MGCDMKQFVKDRDAAFTAFVLHDDWQAIRGYCTTYGVSMPENPKVMAAGIYKAVLCVNDMPEKVKHLAAIKCFKLGFTPFIAPPKEDA